MTLRAVIGDQDPSLLRTILRSRGSRAFYQVRIGADTRPAADDLCNRIRRAGRRLLRVEEHEIGMLGQRGT